MNKYKYTSYDYSKIVKPKIQLCCPGLFGESIIQNAELKDNVLYVTYYNGIDRITIDINVNDLIGVNHG
jgi:hypothetical protein